MALCDLHLSRQRIVVATLARHGHPLKTRRTAATLSFSVTEWFVICFVPCNTGGGGRTGLEATSEPRWARCATMSQVRDVSTVKLLLVAGPLLGASSSSSVLLSSISWGIAQPFSLSSSYPSCGARRGKRTRLEVALERRWTRRATKSRVRDASPGVLLPVPVLLRGASSSSVLLSSIKLGITLPSSSSSSESSLELSRPG